MSHTGQWSVRLHLFEDDHGRRRHRSRWHRHTALTGHGTAQCSPADTNVPGIGDELAAGRAVHDLSPTNC